LVDFGFRLPSAFDNRPLKFDEFYKRTPKVIYVSATPSVYEVNESQKAYQSVLSSAPAHQSSSAPYVVEQIIRPTGLIDPPIQVKPTNNQIPDLIIELKKRIALKQRTLIITLTKKMAEDLSAYLSEPKNTGEPLKVAYLHSDVETLERSTVLDNLRSGTYDVLIGVNLLREGLDLPEVSLVAVLDADQQGFLRSKSSLIQIMGRASRHVDGQVILYADTMSAAMTGAIKEVNRRRKIQLDYNQKNNITPLSIIKSIRPKIIEIEEKIKPDIDTIDPLSLTPPQRKSYISKLRKQMHAFANDLNFEEAIRFRDKILQAEKI